MPLAALAAAGLVALATSPAAAATGRITEITSTGGTLRVIFSASDLPANTVLDPTSVTVTAGGQSLSATAVPVTDTTPVSRTAVLVIDTSGSMQGEGIAGAKAAAKSFVAAVPAGVKVGMISFADSARVAVPPTTDRVRLRRAIDALQAQGETSLYDGVLLGLRTAGRTGTRSVLVLSDGADTRSRSGLPAVVTTARSSGATVNAVAFKTPDATGNVLRQIAVAAKGQLLTASRAGDIGTAFRAAARAISNQLVVTAPIPTALAGKPVTVTVSAKAGTQTLNDEAVTTLGAAAATTPADTKPRPVALETGPFGSGAVFAGALVALFAGLALLLIVGLGSLTPDTPTGRVRRRLSLYTLTGRVTPEQQETTALGDSAVARSAVEFAGRMVARRDFETRLARQLEQGGIPLRPAEWLLVHVGTTIGVALLFLLLSGAAWLPTVVGLVIGFALPYGYLRLKAVRRGNAFFAQVPDTLQLLAGGLSAGYSFPQAIDAVVREGAQPIASEFNRAIVESRLGVPIEDALDNVAERMGSKDFSWVVMAVRIQREVGGNLAEVLSNVANTIRERERVRRQVRVLSAEGRLSALILGGLPPLFALYLLLVRRTYLQLLWQDPIGIALIVLMSVVFAVGVFWLRKVVKVEV